MPCSHGIGFPIRASPDQRLLSTSPGLIAATPRPSSASPVKASTLRPSCLGQQVEFTTILDSPPSSTFKILTTALAERTLKKTTPAGKGGLCAREKTARHPSIILRTLSPSKGEPLPHRKRIREYRIAENHYNGADWPVKACYAGAMRFTLPWRFIPRSSAVLAATTFGSYLLGLLRDRTFAQTFGASTALDAYNAAFLVPDLLFNVLVASGIAAAFVPIFTEILRRDHEAADQYTASILTAASSTMAVIGIVLFLFADSAAQLVAPGLSPEGRTLTAQLMRVLAFSPILFAASNTLGAFLVARGRLLFYGLSPMLYNAGIIAGTLLLAPRFGIHGVVIGTLAGATLHLAIRAVDAARCGFRFRPTFAFGTQEFRRTIALMVPKMFGHPVELATFWGFTAIASTLPSGSIAVLNFARNFQSVPVSVIGIAVGTAIFPLLAQAATDRSPEQFRRMLISASLLILLASSAAALFAFVIREPLIALLLGGRAFDAEAVRRTAIVFGAFTLAIPTEALSQLLARAFYATKNTTIPVALSVLSLLFAVGGAWFTTPALGLLALPLAFAAGSAVKTLALSLLLPRRIRSLTTANRQ